MSNARVKVKKKNFLTIRNYLYLRKIKRILRRTPVEFDELDEKNIEEIIKSNTYSDSGKPLNGFNYALKEDEVINTVIDFYYSISKEMGDTIKKFYNTYKDKIFLVEPQEKDENGNIIDTGTKASEGVTYNPSHPLKKQMPDGTIQDVVCDMELCHNYTTYYTVAHEFMHLMQRALGNENEKLTEVNTRFIEYMLGEYLVEKNIINQNEVDEHNWVNNSQKNRAGQLRDIMIIEKMIKENRLTLNNLTMVLNRNPEQLNANLGGIITSLTGKENESPKNNLRFVNGMVGANRLLEIYHKNKDVFKKVYGKIMSSKYNGQFDYEHFFADIEKEITNQELSEKEIDTGEWKKIEWNDKIFYIRENDVKQNNTESNQQPVAIQQPQPKFKIRVHKEDGDNDYKKRTTILMFDKKLDLLGLSEVYWGNENSQAKLSVRNHNEAVNPLLMNLPTEIEHITETLYYDYGGGNAIHINPNIQGIGLGNQMMFFLISYLKHKKIERLKVSGYATDKDGYSSEGFFLKTGSRKLSNTSSIYDDFADTLKNLKRKITERMTDSEKQKNGNDMELEF